MNLGYAFTEPIDWELDRVQGGKSLSYNIGASGNTPEAGWGEFKDKKYKKF